MEGSTTTTLTYDALNRLTQVAKTGQATQTYVYDDQGRRIQKTVGSTVTNYLYSGPDIVSEYGSTWGSSSALYTHGPNMDDPIIRSTTTNTQYYHQDGLGSVVGVSNSSGTTDATARYDAWGNLLSGTGSIPQYGYTGREPDETGLVNYRNRYYDPSIGRFTQRDPIGMNGGLNLYAYVANNPTNLTDPMGLLPISPEMVQLAVIMGSDAYFGGTAMSTPGLTSSNQSFANTSQQKFAGEGQQFATAQEGVSVCDACGSTETPEPSLWNWVYATREGLVGGITASGRRIGEADRFVALPSREALNRWVEVRFQGISVIAQVWDVGPWSTDDPYWRTNQVPKAELGLRTESLMQRYGPPKNPAGIDLSNQVWRDLRLKNNAWIEWQFIDR